MSAKIQKFKEHNMTVLRTGVRPVEETQKEYN